MKAGMARNTAAKYLKLRDPQDLLRARRTWRIRPDEFAEVWTEVDVVLLAVPDLEAKGIF